MSDKITDARRNNDYACPECGVEILPNDGWDNLCKECCPHENTEDAGLLGEQCLDCTGYV